TETDEDLIMADEPSTPDEFEEQAFWLAFDWESRSKKYYRNPKADKVPRKD
ncbi:hypothetical protein CBX41_017265, partial [Salmonella enterica]|nr:hypothetical protein [Salmonella enterica]